MGWKEGEGLGAKGQGRKEHIKVRRRQDSSGIGLAEATKKSRDWTIGMVAYDQVLAKLSSVSGEPNGKRKRRDADTAPVNEEGGLAAKQGDAAVGTENARKRKKKGPESNALDTMAVSASGPPATLETDEIQATVKSSHTARFARRRAGKNVRSYSGSDLAAILGGGVHSNAAPGSAEAEEGSAHFRAPSPDKTSAAEDVTEQPSAGLAEAGSDRRMDQPDDGHQEKRWWHGYFTPAGRLGSAAPAKLSSSTLTPQVKVNGFSEADQENLYHLAHDKKGQGRQGLGIASRPKKVAGARWQGRKTTIEDSEEEQDAKGEAGPAESEDCSDDTQIFSEEPASASAAAGTKQLSANVDKKILRRQAVLVLKPAIGGLTVKKLEKRVLDGLSIARKSAERTAARKVLRQVVLASSKMSMEDGLVVLRKR
ncbi:g8045 [Coccomyxa elongata]